jgi:methyl-accepting chemotaxis protein
MNMKHFFNNLRLRLKMLLAPVVVFLFLLVIAGGTYYALSLQDRSIDDIYQNRFKGYQASSQILLEMTSVQSDLYKLMTWTAANYDARQTADLIKTINEQITKNVEGAKRIAASPNLTADEAKYYKIASENLTGFQSQVQNTLAIAAADPTAAGVLLSTALDSFKAVDQSLRDLNALEDKLSQATYDQSKKVVKTILLVFLAVVLVAVLVSLLASFSVTNLILKPIREAVHVLRQLAQGDLTQKIHLESRDEIGELIASVNEMRGKMNEAVGQALHVSGNLKDSASDEAASIEETSASLDEISSMTRQNAENTAQANRLMQSAKEAVAKANEAMAKLTGSMQAIAQASHETQKIVKSIDEIAFQTNLLALNASVEAARAGEAGAGFAVVADEVRNLAMRAKDSAQNSTTLIEDIVQKVKGGEDLVRLTSTAFGQVTESSEKVVGLMGEIETASKEQAQGISQINSVIATLSNSTQQNAGNADTLSSIMSIFKTEESSSGPQHRVRQISA